MTSSTYHSYQSVYGTQHTDLHTQPQLILKHILSKDFFCRPTATNCSPCPHAMCHVPLHLIHSWTGTSTTPLLTSGGSSFQHSSHIRNSHGTEIFLAQVCVDQHISIKYDNESSGTLSCPGYLS